jgi:hypothetical protein
MKALRIAILALAYGAATLALADEPPAPPADGKGPQLRDCSRASNPTRCEARQKAIKAAMEKCKGLAEAEHRKCMKEQWKEGPGGKGDDKDK